MSDFPINVRDIMISDPCILTVPEMNRYFIYARSFDPEISPKIKQGNTFYGMESPDLVNWSYPFQVFEKGNDFWADLDYWAPECHFWKGKYYIFSTFRAKGTYRSCQVLVSESPRGPFAPISDEPVTPPGWNCLDGTLYVDRQGEPWMVFCHEWIQVYDGQICTIRLTEDLAHAIGDPIILFRASEAPWGNKGRLNNGQSGFVTDGPWLHRMRNGSLIMLWSSSSAGGYTTGYARSLNGEITGPWVQFDDPLYSLDGGHSSLFRALDGRLMMALHCFNREHRKKRMLLFEMVEDGDNLRIVNEITGNWFNALPNRFHFGRETKKMKEPIVFTTGNLCLEKDE